MFTPSVVHKYQLKILKYGKSQMISIIYVYEPRCSSNGIYMSKNIVHSKQMRSPYLFGELQPKKEVKVSSTNKLGSPNGINDTKTIKVMKMFLNS